MRVEQPAQIYCPKCKDIVGTVILKEVPDKPGFFINVCSPSPLPVYCGTCGGVLIRKVA